MNRHIRVSTDVPVHFILSNILILSFVIIKDILYVDIFYFIKTVLRVFFVFFPFAGQSIFSHYTLVGILCLTKLKTGFTLVSV